MTALEYVASVMPSCTASEHRVLTAIALQVGDPEASVKLSLTELEHLTGLSRSGVRKGVEDAKASGRLNQTGDGNSFVYSLCHDVTQNVSPGSTKRVTKKHTSGDTCVTTKHKSLHEVTHPEEGVHLTGLKAASSTHARTDETQTDAWRFWESLVGRRALEKFKQLRQNHVAWFERYKPHHLTVAKSEALELATKRKKDWLYILADLCENPANSRALEGFAHMTAAPPSPPEPDENGIVLGEIYWHRERRHKVRPVGYRPDWGEYSVEVPIGGEGDPVRGRYESTPPAYLEPWRHQCAA